MKRIAAAVVLAFSLVACSSGAPASDAPATETPTATVEAVEKHNIPVKLVDVVPFNGTINLDDGDCAGYGDKAGQLVVKDAEGAIVALHMVDYMGRHDDGSCTWNTLLENVPVSGFYTAILTTPSGDVFEQTFEGEPNLTSITLTY